MLLEGLRIWTVNCVVWDLSGHRLMVDRYIFIENGEVFILFFYSYSGMNCCYRNSQHSVNENDFI